MTPRQEIVTAIIIMAWVGGCARQGIKAHEAMAADVAMARFEREFLPDLVARDEFYAEARERFEEAYGFDGEGKP